ncbi:MAG: NifU family protein [Nitrospirota bacterium]
MIEMTDIAKSKITTLMQDQADQGNRMMGVRLTYTGRLPDVEYRLAFVEAGKEEPGDTVIVASGLNVFVEKHNEGFLSDVRIDFIESLSQTGFKVNNPKVVLPKRETPDSPPILDTSQAIAIKQVLDLEINPAIANHGGAITLLDVKDNIAYIRMSGGCHGCGSADATLKQGVIVAIKKVVPEILDVLDVTDHASGKNPYYMPK